MKPAIGACIVAFGLAVPWPVPHRQASWCAAPRANEPLLLDVKRLLGSSDSESARHRKTYRLNRSSSVRVLRDEPTCRQASHAYWSVLRRSVPDLFGDHADAPVLTVRVGSVYLVDDQRSRDGPDAYWEVMIFDTKWHRLSGYGAGTDNPEALPDTVQHLTATRGRERPRVSAGR
jgi:hypothetical protein